jgi:hypothetical protein
MSTQNDKWNDRPINSPEDKQGLDAASAIYEFRYKLPRHEAEAKAHADYVREHAINSACHHLLGMRAAHAAGSDKAAKQHSEAYADAMAVLGHPAIDVPPREVVERLESMKAHVYKFSNHGSDKVIPKRPEPEQENNVDTYLDKIQKLRNRL